MIWVLVRKGLLTNLLSLRLTVALIFTVILAVLATFIGSLEYSQRMETYSQSAEGIRYRLGQARVYSRVGPSVVVPPQTLSILCKGVDKIGGQGMGISVSDIPMELGRIGVSDTWFMKSLVEIDFTRVVTLLLSFLAVVMGFDAICSERERGTLRLLLTNSIPRGSIITAKLLTGMFSLWIPLSIGFILALLITLANPDVEFNGDDWIRLAIFFIISCLFLGQVFALSLMVSTFTHRSATALIICLSFWLMGGVGYMNLLPSLTRYGVQEHTWQSFLEQRGEVREEYWRDVNEWTEQHPQPAPAYFESIRHEGVSRYGHPEGYAWLQEYCAFTLNRQLEVAQRVYEIQRENYKPLAQEAQLADRWSVLSPFTNYKTLAKQLARTTIDDKFHLLEAGRRYRETFISYLRGKKAFSSRRWFTDDPEDQEPMIPHPEEVTEEMLKADSPFMKERVKWVEEQEAKASKDVRRQLDLSDLPRFGSDWKRSLPESLMVMTPGLAVLILTFGLSVLIAFMRFLSYDPR